VKWIKKKGIKGRGKKAGRFISNMSLAFIMGKSNKGRRNTRYQFLSKTFRVRFKAVW